jgi:hypothetical protein
MLTMPHPHSRKLRKAESKAKKNEKKQEDKELDKALEDTFPASDSTAKY